MPWFCQGSSWADRNARLDCAICEFESGLLEVLEFQEEKNAINKEVDSQIAALEIEVMSLLHSEHVTARSSAACTPRTSARPTSVRMQSRAASPDWNEGEIEHDFAYATSPALSDEDVV